MSAMCSKILYFLLFASVATSSILHINDGIAIGKSNYCSDHQLVYHRQIKWTARHNGVGCSLLKFTDTISYF